MQVIPALAAAAVLAISLLSCTNDDEDSEPAKSKLDLLSESFDSWKQERPELYSYRVVYAEEKTWSVNVEVQKDTVVCRARAEEGTGLSLIEKGEQVNKNTSVRPLGITLDALYERCISKVKTDPSTEVIYSNTGQLAGCYKPNECRSDWCDPEVVPINSLFLNQASCSKL